jgi:hypothetical protein
MHKALTKESQFNKKVELNIKISNFKKENDIILRGNEPLIEIFIGKGLDSEFIGQIVYKYAKKNKQLTCKHIGYEYKIKTL